MIGGILVMSHGGRELGQAVIDRKAMEGGC